MPNSPRRIYSLEDWRILRLAYCKASEMFDRDIQWQPRADRLARAVMVYFEKGERDFGRLAGMARKREISLLQADERESDTRDVSTLLLLAHRPHYLN